MLARLADRVDVPISEVPLERLRHEFEVEVGPFSLRAALPVTVEDGDAGGVPSRLYTPAEASAPGPLLDLLPRRGLGPGGRSTTHDPCAGCSPTCPACRSCRWTTAWPPSTRSRRAPTTRWPPMRRRRRTRGDFGADPARLASRRRQRGRQPGRRDGPVRAQPRPAPGRLPAADLPGHRPGGEDGVVPRVLLGFSLTERNMDWYADQYVPDPSRRKDPRVSPLRAASLAGLPPAYVATALADPLRDEGEAYARRLAEAGVRVALHRHPLLHGFVNMGGTRAARQAIALTAGALRQGVA